MTSDRPQAPDPGAIDGYLADRVRAGEIPGAVWAIASPDGIVAEGAVGRAMVVPASRVATLDTIYDLGSLTKPLVTSLLFLLLHRDLGVSYSDPARRFLPEIDRLDKRDITLEHLLTHTSGMPDWIPLYLNGRSMREYLAQVRERAPDTRPGTHVVYSCVGYIMLGEILSRCASTPLELLARRFLVEPLGLVSTAFNPPAAWRNRVAPTEDSCQYERKLASSRSRDAKGYVGFRSGVIHGEVHDCNAWALGGVAGNAGLFSTARETVALALEFLGGGRRLLDDEGIDHARSDRTPRLNESRSYAFRLARGGETAAGPGLSPLSFGHNGFPGTSVWMDPGQRRAYVLLTNRVHPRVIEEHDMNSLRRGFHSLASRI